MIQDQDKAITLNSDGELDHVESPSDPKFNAEIQSLIDRAEDFRLRKMRTHSGRSSVSLILGLSAIMVGAGAFGWYFLVEGRFGLALLSLVGSIAIPALLHRWAAAPVQAYKQEFKSHFMPAIAKALGGLKFHPARGISEKILKHTGIVPPYHSYHAEDCFMGRYKGVKIIFSEARLSARRSKDFIFDGIFVLLEVPKDTFSGTTIVTADYKNAKQLSGSLHSMPVTNPAHAEYLHMFSSAPEKAAALNTEALLKELYDMVVLFDKAPLTTVFFKKKYIFMMIPYAVDMFECSNLFLPVTTKTTALQCKKEIDQILSIIDVLEIYRA